MGAYAYCQHPSCIGGLDKPTIAEITFETWECAYGHPQKITEEHRAQALYDLSETVDLLILRVDALEKLQGVIP